MMILGISGAFFFLAAFAGMELIGIFPNHTIAWLVFAFGIFFGCLAIYSDFIDRQNKRLYGISQVRANDDQAA